MIQEVVVTNYRNYIHTHTYTHVNHINVEGDQFPGNILERFRVRRFHFIPFHQNLYYYNNNYKKNNNVVVDEEYEIYKLYFIRNQFKNILFGLHC